jgi:hypothetical protein
MSGPAILLIVLGVILGPAYYGYCEYLSGENLQSMTVTERSDRWTLPDGTIQRFRKGLAYRPVVLVLEPDLNRLRLSLTFDFPAEGDSPQVEYLATLLDQDYPAIEQPLLLRPTGRVDMPVRTFEVQAPGNYLFLLEEVGPPRAAASVTVHLRGRIEKPVRPLMWFGYGLSLVGLGLLAYSLAARTTRRLPLR